MSKEIAFHSKYPNLVVCLIPGTTREVNGTSYPDPGLYVQFADYAYKPRFEQNPYVSGGGYTKERVTELLLGSAHFNKEGRVSEAQPFCLSGVQQGAQPVPQAPAAKESSVLTCKKDGCDFTAKDEDSLNLHLITHDRRTGPRKPKASEEGAPVDPTPEEPAKGKGRGKKSAASPAA